MKRHASPFLASAIVHILLAVAFFYAYKYVAHLMNAASKKNTEERVCVNLSCCFSIDKKPIETKKRETKKAVSKTAKIEKKITKVVKSSLPIPSVKKKTQDPEIKEIVEKVEIFNEEKREESIILTEQNEEIATTQELNDTITETDEIQKERYVNDNLQKISQLLSDNLYYPRNARKRGVVGKVVIKFKLSTDATVSEIEIVSSKSDILSRAAVKTIRDLSGKFPKPTENLILRIPIKYSLTGLLREVSSSP